MTPSELKNRAKRERILLIHIAQSTGIEESHLNRMLNGKTPMPEGTAQRIHDCIETMVNAKGDAPLPSEKLVRNLRDKLDALGHDIELLNSMMDDDNDGGFKNDAKTVQGAIKTKSELLRVQAVMEEKLSVAETAAIREREAKLGESPAQFRERLNEVQKSHEELKGRCKWLAEENKRLVEALNATK